MARVGIERGSCEKLVKQAEFKTEGPRENYEAEVDGSGSGGEREARATSEWRRRRRKRSRRRRKRRGRGIGNVFDMSCVTLRRTRTC